MEGLSCMCGRFALFESDQVLSRGFAAPMDFRTFPRYNIAPSQPVLAVRQGMDGSREFTHLLWGLVPAWSKDPSTANRFINARAETVAEKPAFGGPFRHHRCLVPASGFFEWKGGSGEKRPYFIRRKGGGPIGLAAIWESWLGADGSEAEACAILTTSANAVVAPIHGRMPVIVSSADYGLWLDTAVREPADLARLLVPFPAGEMEAYPVSRMVNDPSVDREECVAGEADGSLPCG
jgi:putative SOS response-associated peptidase YedK